MFLDVDGVLNVLRQDIKDNQKREVRFARHSFYPNDLTLHFMRWAWPIFDVRWLTAWYEGANEIADWAKLPHRPALREGKHWKPGDWKTHSIQRFKEVRGRRIAWVEDGFSDEAKAWREARRDAVLIPTEPHEGVTWGTIHALEGLCLR